MKKRKVPMRKDIVTGEMAPKKDLVRIVRDKDNNVSVDPTGKKSGRGAYISLDVKVAQQAKKNSIPLTKFSKLKLTRSFMTIWWHTWTINKLVGRCLKMAKTSAFFYSF